MKKFCWSSMLLVIAIGCGQSSPPMSNNSAPVTVSTDEPLPEGTLLVTLKLPEMT